MAKHCSDSESESEKKKRRVVSQDQAEACGATVRQILQEKKKEAVGESLPVSESLRREISDDDDDDDVDMKDNNNEKVVKSVYEVVEEPNTQEKVPMKEEEPSTQETVLMDEEVPTLFTGKAYTIGKGLQPLGEWKGKQHDAHVDMNEFGHRYLIASQYERGGYKFRSVAEDIDVYNLVKKKCPVFNEKLVKLLNVDRQKIFRNACKYRSELSNKKTTREFIDKIMNINVNKGKNLIDMVDRSHNFAELKAVLSIIQCMGFDGPFDTEP